MTVVSRTTTPATRRFELDWLRVLAIAAVFLFHSTRFFDQADWHVKNMTRYAFLDTVAMVVIIFMMPLLFVVSGASTFYALKRRSGAEFLRDRVLRLGAPLVVGILTFGAWQVYLERLTHHQFNGSFWQFIPHYFQGRYGEVGNFAWMGLHLWYLELLLALSVIFLPLFLWRATSPLCRRVRLNEELIASRVPPGSTSGASYSHRDALAQPGVRYYYWLEAVDTYGQTKVHGPVSATLAK